MTLRSQPNGRKRKRQPVARGVELEDTLDRLIKSGEFRLTEVSVRADGGMRVRLSRLGRGAGPERGRDV
jgi:hypothetical protein